MKINIDHIRKDLGTLYLFDCLYAYRQSLTQDNRSDWQFEFNSQNKSDIDLDILLIDVFDPRSDIDFSLYDLILLSNRGEPLSIFSDEYLDLLHLEQTYIISNSFLNSGHTLRNKIIWTPGGAIAECMDCWHRSFYPMTYQHTNLAKKVKQNQIVGINGANRAHRHYFFELLKQSESDIKILSNINSTINKTRDAVFESPQDTEFRMWLTARYEGSFSSNSQTQRSYHNSAVPVGIDSKFGKVSPGYWLMPEYYENVCVIFPESCWLNDELSVTEKAFKCFYADSMPFPIGGSNINQLYNELGFYTAWNLLPKHLQEFDAEKNHQHRYQKAVEAILWLDKNKDIFNTVECKHMRLENKLNAAFNHLAATVMEKFCSVIQKRAALVGKNPRVDLDSIS